MIGFLIFGHITKLTKQKTMKYKAIRKTLLERAYGTSKNLSRVEVSTRDILVMAIASKGEPIRRSLSRARITAVIPRGSGDAHQSSSSRRSCSHCHGC
jgi:hypothetical protein